MRNISDHGGAVVGVTHSRSVTAAFRSSTVVLRDGSEHVFSELGYSKGAKIRELDRMLDVSKARRLLILWVPRELKRWKRGPGFMCLGRLWFQTTPAEEPKPTKL